MSDTAVTTDELLLVQAENMRETDTGTQGGAISDPQVVLTGAAVGEWFAKMAAPASGTLGTDYETQYAKVFAWNDNADSFDLEDSLFWVTNLLDDVVSSGNPKVQSSDSADNDDYKERFWIKVGSSLIVEDVIYDGTTLASGLQTAAMVYRSRTLLSSNDSAAVLTGTGTIKVGSTTIGSKPAGVGWNTRELDFGKVATLDDSGTSTNRKTAPAGISFSRCRDSSSALDMGTVTASSGRGLWGRQRLEPGMPPINRVDFCPFWTGESST